MGSVPEMPGGDAGANPAASPLRFLAFALGALGTAFWLWAIFTVVSHKGPFNGPATLYSIGPLSIIFAVTTIPALELSIKGRWPRMALVFGTGSVLANMVWWSYFRSSFAGL